MLTAIFGKVSTHSRLKAAGFGYAGQRKHENCFNTQPPEGGWQVIAINHEIEDVSTHSRLKAAGSTQPDCASALDSFNTQPPEGGWKPTGKLFKLKSKFQHTAA